MKRTTTRQKAATLARGARKAVSVLACFALAFSMLGIPAFADEGDPEEVPANEEVTTPDEGTSEEGGNLNEGWTLITDDGEDASEVTEGEEGIVPSPDEVVPLDEVEGDAAGDATLNIVNVEIIDAKIFPGDVTTKFNVSLSGAGSHSRTKGLTAVDDGSYRTSVTMDEVVPGEYTLTITADRYQTYTQPLYIYDDGAHSYRVRIYTWDYKPVADDFYPGVMFYGDLDNDAVIDHDDVDILVDALSTGTDEDLAAYNLTGQGTTNLADLLVLSDAVDRDEVLSSEQRSALANVNNRPSPDENWKNVDISENVTTVIDETSLAELTDIIGNPDAKLAIKLQTEEPIGEDNPVIVEMNNLDSILATPSESGQPATVAEVEGMTIKPPTLINDDGTVASGIHPHSPTEGTLTITFDEDGKEVTQEVSFRADESSEMFQNLARALGLLPEKAYALTPMMAKVEADGTIVIDFGRTIAIKRVTLRVTKTAAADGNLNLAEISTVEFLNHMEDKVDAPEMNIPEGLQAQPLSKSFKVSWNKAQNVTGYQVWVENGGAEQIYSTTGTTMTITAFKAGVKGKIQNGVTYNVRVQSTNGNWKSGWSEAISVTPKATKAPDAPENVQAVGSYRMIKVSWKAMEDTDFYNIYYRVKDDNNPNGIWEKIGGINGNSYTLTGLADETYYQIHVKGENEIGVSPPSATVAARTTSISPATLPQYQKISPSAIKSSKVVSGAVHYPDGTTNSNGMALFDDDYQTYFQINDWDYGVTYHYNDWGICVEFNEAQDIGYISFAAAVTDWQLGAMRVAYVDQNGAKKTFNNVPYYTRTCNNGRKYVIASLEEGIKAKSVRIGFQTKNNARYINVAEMNFHGADGILRDVNALYTDEMHNQLAANVTEQMLTDLQTRLDTPDPTCGEYTPLRSVLQLDLNYAKQLFADQQGSADQITQVHTDLSTSSDNGKNLKFSGLNAWQPLGKAVAAEQEIIVYASSPSYNNGTASKLQLLVGQQCGESSNAPSTVCTLKTGRNIVTIPKKASYDDREVGGQLYVQYTGTNAKEKWSVRVLGAAELPVLDLYKVTDPVEKQKRAQKFADDVAKRAAELAAVAKDQAKHEELHRTGTSVDEKSIYVKHAYKNNHCFLNATEVMTDHILFSGSAAKMNAALGSGNRAARIIESVEGVDQFMDLLYQHKGLMEPTATSGTIAATNQVPVRHLNVRLMTMFSGAFMYAAGNHIGVGYAQSANFVGLAPMSAAAIAPGGTRASGEGEYFGWGTAHEIGHNINDGAYAVAEVTNNYFAQIGKTSNGGTTRFKYDQVYNRVASGEMGRTRSVFVQLAMYWQLMLAHDPNQVYTQYGTYADLQANRFFARVDSYSRNPGSAPAPGGVALTLDGGESQNIIRLACAAAQKDLRGFFKAWGFASNAKTDDYAKQFPAETRAVQYVSDATVEWSRANPNAANVAGKEVIAVSPEEYASKVTLNITCTDPSVVADGSLVGYEIRRCRYEEGKAISEPAGFAAAGANGAATFTDDASHLGNRTVWYQVTAIDKFLNWSETAKTVQTKLTGDGIYSPAGWTATTNMSSDLNHVSADVPVVSTGDEPSFEDDATKGEEEKTSQCGDEFVADDYDVVQDMVQGKLGRDYVGKADTAPYVLIDMHETYPVSSVRYAPGEGTAITNYKIEASTDGIKFNTVKEGTFDFTGGLTSNDVYFNGKDDEGNPNPWVVVEQARYLKITATSQAKTEISIKELSIFGPSSDDVGFAKVPGEESIPAVGILDEDYILDAEKGEKIPAGSVVFTGNFKGNPAYNVVVLFDENGKIIGATDLEDGSIVSHQAILAEVPENAMIGNTSDGRWIYWMSQDAAQELLGKNVRAELYRVNNAFTNEGQRMVADTMLEPVPTSLPTVHFTGGAGGTGGGGQPETPGNSE